MPSFGRTVTFDMNTIHIINKYMKKKKITNYSLAIKEIVHQWKQMVQDHDEYDDRNIQEN